MMASVSGRRMSIVLPLPATLWIATVPRKASMLRRTTSMPTPRPDKLVMVSAVEKPASKISLRISSSAGTTPCSTRPRAQARASTLSREMPRPSSWMRIKMPPDSWQADSVSLPCAGLPAASRASGDSRPWSRPLRTRCISGSAMRSTTDLSSSVSPPTISSATSLPSSAAVSRTTRLKREKVSPIGTMRNFSVPLRISSISRPIWVLASIRLRCLVCRASSWAPAPAITSSPSRLITASSRSACTRMKCLSSGAAAAAEALRALLGWCNAASTTRALTPCSACRMWPSGGTSGAAGGVMTSWQSSRTKLKAASIASCVSAVCSTMSKPSWHCSGSSSSSAGTAAVSQVTVGIVPRPAT